MGLEEAIGKGSLDLNANEEVSKLLSSARLEAVVSALDKAGHDIYVSHCSNNSVLADKPLQPQESILVLHVGQTTVHAVTLKCEDKYPLRLTNVLLNIRLLVPGVDNIAERFKQEVTQRLCRESYLWNDKKNLTLETLVHGVTSAFEERNQVDIDVTDREKCELRLVIEGLRERENQGNGLYHNVLQLDQYVHLRKILVAVLSSARSAMKEIFRPTLEAIRSVLERCLCESKQNELSIKHVIFMGDYSQSQSLSSHVRLLVKEKKIDYVIVYNRSYTAEVFS